MSDLEHIDGGEQTISCSDCNMPLMHYRVHTPKHKSVQKLVAKCPFCNGQSFMKTIEGLFWYGPIGPDESVNFTTVVGMDLKDGIWYFSVSK
jgi:uncharacterized Zn-finger protein